MVDLVAHLRVLGESNAVRARRRALRRDTALASAAAYHSMFAAGDGGDATVPATFQVIYMTGWAPHANQQQAKRRGSATVSFTDLAGMADADEGETKGAPGGGCSKG